jgi:hypothetical protein
MSGAAVDLGDAVPVADELIAAGDLPRALSVLRTALAGVAPDTAAADPDLAAACLRYAGVLACLGETHSAAPYAAYAYGALRVLPGQDGTAALRAGVVYAFVLRATGALAAATVLYQDLSAAVRLRFGPYARAALAARADLAVALHLAGECVAARQAMHGAYFTHRDAYGPGDEPGIRMLARLGAMTRDCGDFERAHQYFDTAKQLCAGHLPAEHPLAREVTALARAGSDTGHACGRPAARPGVDVADLFLGVFTLPDAQSDAAPRPAARPGAVPAAPSVAAAPGGTTDPAPAPPVPPTPPAATFGRLRRSAPRPQTGG